MNEVQPIFNQIVNTHVTAIDHPEYIIVRNKLIKKLKNKVSKLYGELLTEEDIIEDVEMVLSNMKIVQ